MSLVNYKERRLGIVNIHREHLRQERQTKTANNLLNGLVQIVSRTEISRDKLKRQILLKSKLDANQWRTMIA